MFHCGAERSFPYPVANGRWRRACIILSRSRPQTYRTLFLRQNDGELCIYDPMRRGTSVQFAGRSAS